MTDRGRFITLEGIEGVGKSTQAALLADWLEERGVALVRSREPGGTPAAEAIRDLLKRSPVDSISGETELLLIFAARASHAEYLLRPALAAGRWVLCDRYLDASYAYQGAGRGLGDARVTALADWLVPDLVPDLTLLLDLPVEEALARLPARGAHDRFEREGGEFFRRVREAYLARAAEKPTRVKRVDANGSPEAVQARCRALVAPLLEAGGGKR